MTRTPAAARSIHRHREGCRITNCTNSQKCETLRCSVERFSLIQQGSDGEELINHVTFNKALSGYRGDRLGTFRHLGRPETLLNRCIRT